MNDDPQVLLHAKRYTPVEVLFEPEAWGTLSTSSYTPLVTLSFDLDLALFGMTPSWFYVHQLTALALCFSLLSMFLYRLSGSWIGSLLGTVVAVASPAAVIAARQLMLRHYIEGGALALAALLVWMSARVPPDSSAPSSEGDAARYELRGQRRAWIAASLYFLAMLAKEIYAPLPLLFLALELRARAPFRRTFVRMLPSVAAAIGYLALRSRQLGSGGGYTSIEAGDLMQLPADLLRLIVASGSASPVVAAAIVAILVVILVRKRGARSVWIAALAFLFVLLPLAAVAGAIEGRYTWLPVMAIATLIALSWSGSLVSRVSVVLLALLVAGGGVIERLRILKSSTEMVTEGRYIWTAPADAAVLLGDAPGWYLAGLRDLRMLERREKAPRFILSEEAFLLNAASPSTTVDVVGNEMVPVTKSARGAIVERRLLRDETLPITASISRNRSSLHWEIGPSCDCDFHLITLPEMETYPVPRNGSRRVPLPTDEQLVQLLRVERDGRWNLTAPLQLPAEGAMASTGR